MMVFRLLLAAVVIPLLLILAWPISAIYRRRPGYFTVAAVLLVGFLAVFQFVFYGPFVDQSRVVYDRASVALLHDAGIERVEFTLRRLPFGPVVTGDADVLAHVRQLPAGQDVTLGVELVYDFGRLRAMKFNYAYVDSLLFRPEADDQRPR